MSSIRSKVSRTDIVALTLALAVGLTTVACAGSGAASATGTSVESSTLATSSAATARNLVLALQRRETVGLVTPTPNAPATVEIDDPTLGMILPEGWEPYPMETHRLIVDSFATASSPDFQAYFARHLKDIDSGAVRMVAGGPIGGANGSLIVQVDTGDRSLDAAVTRLRDLGLAWPGSTLVDERPVTLPIGKAVRLVETHAVPAGVEGVPSRTVEYITRLEDGRTLWIIASGPAAAPTFEALIDASVMSLRAIP